VGLQKIHEHEALGGGHGRRLYCRLTSFSQSLQTNLRITLDGTKIFCSKQTVFRTFCMKMPGRKLDGVPLCLLNFDSKHWGTPSNKNRAAVYIASYPHN